MMKLSAAQIAVLANLKNGCGLVTSAQFGNTFWSRKAKKPKMDFILPSTVRKLHFWGLIERRELLVNGGERPWDHPNTFITKEGLQALNK